MTANIFDELHADDATMGKLHTRLEHAADADGVLDVAYRTIDTPVGTLLLAATPVGLVRVAYDVEGHDAVLGRLADAVSPRILRSPLRLDTVARQLDEYFAKRRTTFDVPVDLRLADGFRRSVIEHLRDIGYGRPRELCDRRRCGRQPQGGTGSRHRLRPQSAAGRDPLPPRRAVRRVDGPVRGWTSGQGDAARPRGRLNGNESAGAAVEQGHETQRRRP